MDTERSGNLARNARSCGGLQLLFAWVSSLLQQFCDNHISVYLIYSASLDAAACVQLYTSPWTACCSQGNTPLAPQVVFRNLACTNRFGASLQATAPKPKASADRQQASYLPWLEWNLQVSKVCFVSWRFIRAHTHAWTSITACSAHCNVPIASKATISSLECLK